MIDLLNTEGAAKILKCSVSKLNKGRCLGTLDIPFIKNGRQVLYARSDLLKWLERHRHQSTSEYLSSAGPGRGHKKAR